MKPLWKRILSDRYGELRSGWRITSFVCAFLLLSQTAIAIERGFGLNSPLGERVLSLGAALGAGVVLTRGVNRKPFSAIGIALHQSTFKELGVGCLLGFLMIAGIVFIESAMGYIVPVSRGLTGLEAALLALASLVYFAVGAMVEELLFRGYAFQTLIQAVTFLPATILMATLFCLAHSQNPHVSPLFVINVVLAGGLFAFAYMKTRSLWLPLGIHVAWDFTRTTLFGLPTGGLHDSSRALLLATQSGPEWIGGGECGPEGGILATIAIIICAWYVLKAPYLNAPEGIITLDSIEDLIGPGNGRGARAT